MSTCKGSTAAGSLSSCGRPRPSPSRAAPITASRRAIPPFATASPIASSTMKSFCSTTRCTPGRNGASRSPSSASTRSGAWISSTASRSPGSAAPPGPGPRSFPPPASLGCGRRESTSSSLIFPSFRAWTSRRLAPLSSGCPRSACSRPTCSTRSCADSISSRAASESRLFRWREAISSSRFARRRRSPASTATSRTGSSCSSRSRTPPTIPVSSNVRWKIRASPRPSPHSFRIGRFGWGGARRRGGATTGCLRASRGR